MTVPIAVLVRRRGTGELLRRFETAGLTERQYDRFLAGLLSKLREDCYLEDDQEVSGGFRR